MRHFDSFQKVLRACGQNNLVLLTEQVAGHGGTNALAGTTDDEDFRHGPSSFASVFLSEFSLNGVDCVKGLDNKQVSSGYKIDNEACNVPTTSGVGFTSFADMLLCVKKQLQTSVYSMEIVDYFPLQ